jgi:hypothetical protein
MRSVRVAVAAAFCGLAVAMPHASASAPVYDAVGTARLYTLVNTHRAAIGLRPLSLDRRLADVAKSWTLHMAATGVLSHNDALFTKTMHTTLGIKNFGENVAYASLGVDRANVILLESPKHRENIENGAFAVGGFAVYQDAKGVTWVTEDFGTPPVTVAARVAPKPRPVASPPAPVKPRPAARPAPAPRPAPAAPAVRRLVPAHGGFAATQVEASAPVTVHVATRAAAATPQGAARWPVVLAAVLVGTVATAGRRTLRA